LVLVLASAVAALAGRDHAPGGGTQLGNNAARESVSVVSITLLPSVADSQDYLAPAPPPVPPPAPPPVPEIVRFIFGSR
ncbi:MAG: hypothetical protein H7232_08945, partial [Aeromicrobium sp.]|nr:hypothetical protein [Burkholderiales bacterium]